jgi:hypothetical protein
VADSHAGQMPAHNASTIKKRRPTAFIRLGLYTITMLTRFGASFSPGLLEMQIESSFTRAGFCSNTVI